MVKNLPADAGDIRDVDSISGWRKSPGGGHGNPLQYSCLENPMDTGVWWATVHGVTKSRTRLKRPHARTSTLFLFQLAARVSAHAGFLQEQHAGAAVCPAPPGGGVSRCGARAPGARASVVADAGSVVVANGPSCPAAGGTFLHQPSTPCPLQWQEDS